MCTLFSIDKERPIVHLLILTMDHVNMFNVKREFPRKAQWRSTGRGASRQNSVPAVPLTEKHKDITVCKTETVKVILIKHTSH